MSKFKLGLISGGGLSSRVRFVPFGSSCPVLAGVSGRSLLSTGRLRSLWCLTRSSACCFFVSSLMGRTRSLRTNSSHLYRSDAAVRLGRGPLGVPAFVVDVVVGRFAAGFCAWPDFDRFHLRRRLIRHWKELSSSRPWLRRAWPELQMDCTKAGRASLTSARGSKRRPLLGETACWSFKRVLQRVEQGQKKAERAAQAEIDSRRTSVALGQVSRETLAVV
jgi:hypothetical protein